MIQIFPKPTVSITVNQFGIGGKNCSITDQDRTIIQNRCKNFLVIQFLIHQRAQVKRRKFIEAVRIARPDVILAPPAGMRDYNQDHDMTGYLAFQARVLATVKASKTEHDIIDHIPPLFYCTPLGGMCSNYHPQYFVDISEEFEDKMNMFKCHDSQQGDWCRDAFGVSYNDILKNENEYYASMCGTPNVQYVEAFELCERWPVIAGAHKLLP